MVLVFPCAGFVKLDPAGVSVVALDVISRVVAGVSGVSTAVASVVVPVLVSEVIADNASGDEGVNIAVGGTA